MLEKEWGLFCKVMERCGKAVGPENVEQYDAAMAAAGRSCTAESAVLRQMGRRSAGSTWLLGNAAMVTNAIQHAGVAGSNRRSVWTSRELQAVQEAW